MYKKLLQFRVLIYDCQDFFSYFSHCILETIENTSVVAINILQCHLLKLQDLSLLLLGGRGVCSFLSYPSASYDWTSPGVIDWL